MVSHGVREVTDVNENMGLGGEIFADPFDSLCEEFTHSVRVELFVVCFSGHKVEFQNDVRYVVFLTLQQTCKKSDKLI